MTQTLSLHSQATAAHAIPTVSGWAARYAGAAGPLIDLTQAVPGYPPHPDLLARLDILASDRATSGYGPIEGDLPSRAALADDMAGSYGAGIAAADIAITAGCNLAFSMTMAVLGGPVVLPVPWYFNHRMALEMAGIPAIPLPCRAEDGFIPTAAGIEAALRAGGRVLVLVTPNNPTGAVYPAALIAEAAALCRRRGAWLVLDETYRDFLAAEACPPHALFRDPAWREGLVHLYSFSKAYCVPGHRIGAIACGPVFRDALLKALDTQQICPPRAAQAALAWAVPALRGWRAGNRAIMAERGEAFRQVTARLSGWRLDALGAYFAYLRLPEDSPSAMPAAEALATGRGLLGLPGPFFGPGQERHLRLAFANVELPAISAIAERVSNDASARA